MRVTSSRPEDEAVVVGVTVVSIRADASELLEGVRPAGEVESSFSFNSR